LSGRFPWERWRPRRQVRSNRRNAGNWQLSPPSNKAGPSAQCLEDAGETPAVPGKSPPPAQLPYQQFRCDGALVLCPRTEKRLNYWEYCGYRFLPSVEDNPENLPSALAFRRPAAPLLASACPICRKKRAAKGLPPACRALFSIFGRTSPFLESSSLESSWGKSAQ